MAATTAKSSLAYLCRILRSYNIKDVSPEDLRQAKFNGPVGPKLIKVLHALVVLTLANGLNTTSTTQVSDCLDNLAQNELASDHLSADAILMAKLYLLAWGCPPRLASHLHPACGSRLVLLMLGWLVDHSQLFYTWHAQVGYVPPPDAVLPTLLYDTSHLPVPQHARSATASAWFLRQQQATTRISQLPPPRVIDGSMQHVLVLLGKADKLYKDASSMLESHIAASHQILQSQQPTPQLTITNPLFHSHHHSSTTTTSSRTTTTTSRSSSGATSRHPPPPPGAPPPAPTLRPGTLTPLEVHLLANPSELQRQQEAVLSATQALTAQLECRQQAAMFSQWMLSVLQEHLASQAAKSQSPALLDAQAHIDPTLLATPLPTLQHQCNLLFNELQRHTAAAATAAATRRPKPSANLSMYSRTPPSSRRPPSSSATNPSKPPQPAPATATVTLEDFTPSPSYTRSHDPATLSPFLQLPPDLTAQLAAAHHHHHIDHQQQQQQQSYSVSSGTIRSPATTQSIMLSQDLAQPQLQAAGQAPSHTLSGNAPGQAPHDPGAAAAAEAASQVLEVARQLAKTRASVKRKLLGALAPVAAQEDLVVHGV